MEFNYIYQGSVEYLVDLYVNKYGDFNSAFNDELLIFYL